MKRLHENVHGESEMMGLKKGRSLGAISKNFGALGLGTSQEDSVFTVNEATDSAQLDNRVDCLFGNIVPSNFESSSLSVVDLEANKWDFDINFDLIFGNGEEQTGFSFDLKAPVVGTECAGIEKASMNNGTRVEIIDIASDDSDSEVEITGFNIGCAYAKGKQVEVAMSCDDMENLNFVLGSLDMDNIFSGTSLHTGNEMGYAREEKGNASVVYPWLSLGADYPIDLDLWPEREESIEIVEPRNDVEVIPWQPLALPRPGLPEQVSREAEQATRIRRDAARRFARINYEDEDHGIGSINQKERPLVLKAVEQLGNSPGPFSEALKNIRRRTLKRTADSLIEWKPSVKNQDNSIAASRVPSLLDLSMRALAENAEGLVSLELVPDLLRKRLADVLCDTRKMDAHVLKLLVEGCPTEIRIKNSSWVTETQFQQTFGSCQTKNLRVLQLDLCGQFMCDFILRDSFGQSLNTFSSLAILSLRGACRLSDSGLKELLVSAPKLQSINLGSCTLLTHHAINFIASSLGSNLRELWIDECQRIDAMLILSALHKCTNLEVLSVASIETVTDQFISEMLTVCGRSIKELDLANCLKLTDWSLKSIGSSCAGLCSINISNLDNLTDVGIEYLANGCRSVQRLKLSRNGFSDEAMAAFLEASGGSLVELLLNNVTKVGPNTALSLANHSRKLLSLDISWCRRISNAALGLIVDSCSSLKLLKVFGCRQITSVFQNGHSNKSLRIIGLNLTPLLHHVNLLESDEVLLRYSPLQAPLEPPVEA